VRKPSPTAAATALLLIASFTLAAPAPAADLHEMSSASVSRPVTLDARGFAGARTAQWPQFGYDAGQTAYNPLESVIAPQNVSSLQIAWNDGGIVQPNGIVVDKGVAYVDDQGQSAAGLYALDAATGAQKWVAQVNLNGSWGSFNHPVSAVAGGVVVTPCSNGESNFLTGLCGVDASTGAVAWTHFCSLYQGGGCEGIVNGTSPTLYQSRIFFQTTEGVNEQPDTEAINPKTGALVWDVPGVYHCPDAGDTSGNPLPAANGLVFAVLGCQGPSGTTEICALSAKSGGAVWCAGSESACVGGLIAGGDKLFVEEPAASGFNVLAFDAKSGKPLWGTTLPGGGRAMALSGSRLFVSAGATGVYALSVKNGAQLWSYTANGNYTVGGVLSVANGVVYTDGGGGNNGNDGITALSEKNGALLWASSFGNGSAPATPVIVDGAIYAGCYTLCALTLPGSPLRR
jgi:outer membrane protein assembly factor BamB